MLPRYQVVVISSRDGKLLRAFDDTGLTLQYSRVLNGIGSVVVTFPYTPDLEGLFLTDDFLEILRTHPVTGLLQVEETYLIRLMHKFQEDDRTYLLVGGQSLNHLIQRRVVDPNEDPLQAGGYSTKGGDAATLIRDYAREQMGDLASVARRFPNLTVPPETLSGVVTGERLRYEPLFPVFERLAKKGDTDFQIVRASGANLELRVGKQGADKTEAANYPLLPFVMLDPRRGNVAAPSLEHDRRNEANFIYFLGGGQGANQTILAFGTENVAETPFSRIEFVETASNTEKGANALDMLRDAQAKLDDNRSAAEFTFVLPPDMRNTVYRAEWDLGDRITANWDGFKVDVRVKEIEIELGEDGQNMTVRTEALP